MCADTTPLISSTMRASRKYRQPMECLPCGRKVGKQRIKVRIDWVKGGGGTRVLTDAEVLPDKWRAGED